MKCSCGRPDCRHAQKTECEACFQKRGPIAEKTVNIWHRETKCCTCGESIIIGGHVVSTYGLRSESTSEMEVAAVEAIITHPAGYDLDLFGGMLVIRSTGGPMNDEETFEVEWGLSETNVGCKSFPRDAAHEAATFFVNKRRALRLGLDFERA